jgi:hypothetical protein
MEATFLGHQTWLISHDGSGVLVDPVLTDTFGHSDAISSLVFPPRRIDVAAMPPVDAVVLSHEHSDHFTFESFAALPRETPVYVGPLMVSPVADAIESMGFAVHRLLPSQWVSAGALEFCLFAVAEDSFWEQRVVQVYVRPREVAHRAVFVGIDAAISPFLIDAVKAGEIENPRLVISANNSQIVPKGGKSIFTNPLEDIGEVDEGPYVGLDVLDALTLTYTKDLPPGCEVAIMGDGLVHARQQFGPYLVSDHRRLAEIANRLSVKPWVHGSRPGDALVIDEDGITRTSVDWIEIDRDREQALLQQQRAFVENPTEPQFQPVLESTGRLGTRVPDVLDELRWLGHAFALSKLALLGHKLHEYLNGALGSRRFVLRLVADHGATVQVAYDHAEARFVPDQTPVSELLETFPFGLEMYLADFVGILDGRIQVWDLDGTAVNAWALRGAVTEGPAAFMFAALGEQVRPDLAARTYIRALERLSITPNRKLLERAERL